MFPLKQTPSFPVRQAIACLALAAVAWAPAGQSALAAGEAEHVVIMVWDGLRPDFITPRYTPALRQLADHGVFFQHHHSVYICSTEVNAVALATGVWPARSTIVANKEYRPDINPSEPVWMQELATVRRGDELTGGHFLAAPTLADLVQSSGGRTAVAGVKPVALLLDRQELNTPYRAGGSMTFFNGHVLPPSAMPLLVTANHGKAFPSKVTFPNTEQNAWATRALTQGMWKNGVPKLSILWLSEPDYTQHNFGPGSKQALGALASADKCLGAVLAALEEKGVRDKTDLFVVSDHGFSTIERGIDIVRLLRKAGLKAVTNFKHHEPGEFLVVPLGGSVAVYVPEHEQALVTRLVAFFQSTDFAGVIFARAAAEGTFPLSAVRLDSPGAPDLLVSLRWSRARNVFGTPGLLPTSGIKDKGTHSSLSPYDLHNSLVAAGPDFRSGFYSELPSGNLDLAPTVAWILGLQAPQPMDGRLLAEALLDPPAPPPQAEAKTLEASCASARFHWRQYLKIQTVGAEIYLDEGNGESNPN